MSHYCDNTLCEWEAVKTVPVSLEKPGDSKRRLCASCEEAYSMGAQHGRMTTEAAAKKEARRQAKQKDRTIADLRRSLRQTRKAIREAMTGVWNGSAEGWEYVILGIDRALLASRPQKGVTTP